MSGAAVRTDPERLLEEIASPDPQAAEAARAALRTLPDPATAAEALAEAYAASRRETRKRIQDILTLYDLDVGLAGATEESVFDHSLPLTLMGTFGLEEVAVLRPGAGGAFRPTEVRGAAEAAALVVPAAAATALRAPRHLAGERAAWATAAVATGYEVVLPFAGDEPYALLLLGRRMEGAAWRDEDLQFLSVVASIVVGNIARARAHRDLEGAVAEAVVRERSAAARAAQAERLAALGRLAAGVAHEMNNPLGVILGFADHLLARAGREHPHAHDLENIRREADRCRRLVQDLVDYARPPRLRRAPWHVGAGLCEAAARAPRGARIEVEAEAVAAIVLEADHHRMCQILDNLVGNACDAAGPTGRVRLSAVPVATGIRITVSDDGPGIPEAIRDQIFEPFVTGKERGTGLGLAITRQMVEAHGGRIDFETGSGGTTFRVEMPA